MAHPSSQHVDGEPAQDPPQLPQSGETVGLGNSLPTGRFRFTTFVDVKAIEFPRRMSSSDDEGESKRKLAGYYPGKSDDEQEAMPHKQQKMSRSRAAPSSVAAKSPSTRGAARRGSGVHRSGVRGSGVRGVKWTEEEDTFVLETWATWPECQYDELTETMNEIFGNDRTSGGLRQRYAGKKKWMLDILDAATDKNAPSMGWAQK